MADKEGFPYECKKQISFANKKKNWYIILTFIISEFLYKYVIFIIDFDRVSGCEECKTYYYYHEFYYN